MSDAYKTTSMFTSIKAYRAGIKDSAEDALFNSTSHRRQQACLQNYGEYTEDDSDDDDTEDISTFCKYMNTIVAEVSFTLNNVAPPIVSESNAIAVEDFQDYLKKQNMLKRQYRVSIF